MRLFRFGTHLRPWGCFLAHLGGRHWTCEKLLGQGEVSDVYFGRLARWPTELVILKIQRAGKEIVTLKNEWKIVSLLQQSEAPGADFFTALLPQPVVQGEVKEGAFAGRQVNIFRWAGGFRHTLADVRRVYPQGINPRISIWVWRRILEMLSFLHASNIVHGAILPEHYWCMKVNTASAWWGSGMPENPVRNGFLLQLHMRGFFQSFPFPGKKH